MSGRIDVDFAFAPGAVLRMLGLVERRGFDVRGIEMDGAAGSLSLVVEARDSGRRLDVVAGHLRRLHDVRSVSFTPAGVVQ